MAVTGSRSSSDGRRMAGRTAARPAARPTGSGRGRAREVVPEVAQRLEALGRAAANDENIIPAMLDCARAYCTLYEIRHVLEEIYGSYREPIFF